MKVVLKKAGRIEIGGKTTLGELRTILKKGFPDDEVVGPPLLVELLELQDKLDDAAKALDK